MSVLAPIGFLAGSGRRILLSATASSLQGAFLSSIIFCPHCRTENPADARFCSKCGTNLGGGPDGPRSDAAASQSSSSSSPNVVTSSNRKNIGIGGAQVSLPILVLLILLIVQAIFSFIFASDFSDISLSSGDGLFSLSFTALFVIIGILYLVGVFAVFRRYLWGTILVATLAVIGLGVPPAGTIVSIIILAVLVFLNRASLSRISRSTAKT